MSTVSVRIGRRKASEAKQARTTKAKANGKPAKPRKPELFDEIMGPYMDRMQMSTTATRATLGGVREIMRQFVTMADKLKRMLPNHDFDIVRLVCMDLCKQFADIERLAALALDQAEHLDYPIGHLFTFIINNPEKFAELFDQLADPDYKKKHPLEGRVKPVCDCQFCVDDRRRVDSFEARFREAMGCSPKGEEAKA